MNAFLGHACHQLRGHRGPCSAHSQQETPHREHRRRRAPLGFQRKQAQPVPAAHWGTRSKNPLLTTEGGVSMRPMQAVKGPRPRSGHQVACFMTSSLTLAPRRTRSAGPGHQRSQLSGLGRTRIPTHPTVRAAAPPHVGSTSACMLPGMGGSLPVKAVPSCKGSSVRHLPWGCSLPCKSHKAVLSN